MAENTNEDDRFQEAIVNEGINPIVPATQSNEVNMENMPKANMPGVGMIPSNLNGLSKKALAMRDYLRSEEKVGFVIPLDPKEKPGATESVTMNGYSLKIKKGIYVSVPKSVAMLLADSHNVTMEALNDNPTNMNHPESVMTPGFNKSSGGL